MIFLTPAPVILIMKNLYKQTGQFRLKTDDVAESHERSGTMALPLGPGDKAPEFMLNNKDSRATTLNEFAGKWIILFFYPKDNTSG